MTTNILTIDTEDWFHVWNGRKAIPQERWDEMSPKINFMVEQTLELLACENIVATFFIVGWIAEKNPSLIRQIVGHGHEIASHGYWHTSVCRQTPAEFHEDVRRAKACLEAASGQEVKGFRAPGYSIGHKEEWALDILLEAGYKYDSSLLHATEPFSKLRIGLYEVAPNSLSFCGSHLPSNGGFLFRLAPYFLYKFYASYLNAHGTPLVFYTHTWEIFLDYPRIPMSWHKEFIQYANLGSVKRKLGRLIHDFDFTSILKAHPSI